jgi:predicted transcriptional regulator
MKKLTRKEEELMKILWKLEKAFVKDIIEKYPESETALQHHFFAGAVAAG